MNLNHLEIFHAVAEEGSISKGAERLHISQPAVSKQLAEFERAMGTLLFDRVARGVRLTEAGKLLQTYARNLFATEKEAERALLELRGLKRGRLALGASTSIGAYLLPSLLALFHRTYPTIEIHLQISNTEAIQKALTEGALDIGFTEGFLPSDNLAAKVFYQDDLVVIAAPDYPLPQNGPLTLAQVCAEPMLVREPGSGTRAVIEAALHARGLSLQPVMTLGNTEAIKRAVAARAGIAIVSRLAVQNEVQADQLRLLTVVDFQLQRPLHQLQFRGYHTSVTVQAFLNLLPSVTKPL